jgi:hypothetical protein
MGNMFQKVGIDLFGKSDGPRRKRFEFYMSLSNLPPTERNPTSFLLVQTQVSIKNRLILVRGLLVEFVFSFTGKQRILKC